MTENSKSFLICHRGALGDFILTWPAILLLKKHFTEYKFIGLGRPDYMKLAIYLGLLGEYHDADSAAMQDFFENGIIPPELGNPEKGSLWLKDAWETAELIKKNSQCDFAPMEPFPQEKCHVAKFHVREILKYFKVSGSIASAPVNLADFTPLNSSFHKSNTILIHPGSGSLKKNYSPEFYLKVAKFAEAHFKKDVKFILGPVEMERGACKFFPAEKTLAPANASVLADILRGAFLYIGNDSGTSHLSGFLGTPSVILYRNTNPEIWGVVGRKVKTIQEIDESKLLEKLSNIFLLLEHF